MVGMELTRKIEHVAIACAADSKTAEVVVATMRQAGLTVQRCGLGTAPRHEETAAVILVEDAEALDGLAQALRQRSSQPVLVLTSTLQLSSRIVPLLRTLHDLGSASDPPEVTTWRLQQLISRSRRLPLQDSHIDALTGLINRQEFEVEVARASASVGPGTFAGLVFIDFDRFKAINDHLGQRIGDTVLRAIADALREMLIPRDIVARLGGDEFGWLLVRDNEESVVREALNLLGQLARIKVPELASEPAMRLSASAGLTFLRPLTAAATFLTEGEIAGYEAKVRGRKQLVVYQQLADASRRASQDVEVRHFENVARVAAERLIDALTLKSRSLIEAAQREADVCPLTGLYSRRYLNARLAQDFETARSRGRPLTVVMLDLDHFGAINKTRGWPAGDRVLAAFAAAARSGLGVDHWAGRYGGEEFLIVMPGSLLTEGVRTAEKVRAALGSTPIEDMDGRLFHATLSAGVVGMDPDCASVVDLLEEASRVLIRAKEAGRNRVESARPLCEVPVDDADPFDLRRFVKAQSGGTFEVAVDELRRGRKDSHWMWFVFPQLKGLGNSTTALRFGITGIREARAYLAHPVLGPRLHECARALLELDLSCGTAIDIFGGIDAMKLRSSLTLFSIATGPGSDFDRLLAKYCRGERDELTAAMLMLQGAQ
jgi:two-component system, cell cycle response regulator